MSDSVRDELRRLIGSPKVNYNKGFANIPLDAVVGYASDGKNVDIEFGAVEKRSGSKCLDNPSQSRRWQMQFEETISGATLHFGVTWQGVIIAFSDEYPEVPLIVNKTGFTKLAYTDANSNLVTSYELRFDRGTKFWHIPGSASFIIVNDYGDYFVVQKNGCIQFLSGTDEYHMYNTVGRIKALRESTHTTAGIYVDAVFNRRTDPHPFYMTQADPDKYASLKGNIRVLPVDCHGKLGAMSDLKTIYEYDSKYVGMIEMRSMQDGGIYKTHDMVHLPYPLPPLATFFGTRSQHWPDPVDTAWYQPTTPVNYGIGSTFGPTGPMSSRRVCFGLSIGEGYEGFDEPGFRLFMWFDKRFYKAGEDPLEEDDLDESYVNDLIPSGSFILASGLRVGLPIPVVSATFSGIAVSAIIESPALTKEYRELDRSKGGISGLEKIYRATVATTTGFNTLQRGTTVIAEWVADTDVDGVEYAGRYEVLSRDDSDPYYVYLIGYSRGAVAPAYTSGSIELTRNPLDRSIKGEIPLYIKKTKPGDQPIDYYVDSDHQAEPNIFLLSSAGNRDGVIYELEYPSWLPAFIIGNLETEREKQPTYIYNVDATQHFQWIDGDKFRRFFVAMFSGLIWINEDADGKPVSFAENAWRYTIDFVSEGGFVLLKNLGFDNWSATESPTLLPVSQSVEEIVLGTGEIVSPLIDHEIAVRKHEYIDWLLFGHRFAVWNNSEILGISQKCFIRTNADSKNVTSVSPVYGWIDADGDKVFDGEESGKVPGQITTDEADVSFVCGYMPVMALDYTSLRRFAYTATPMQSTLQNPVDFTVNNGRIYAVSGTRLLIGSNSETLLFEFELDLKHEITAVKSIFEGVVIFGKHDMYYISSSGAKREIANKLSLISLRTVKAKELNNVIYGITESNDIFQLIVTFPDSGEPYITCNNLSGNIPDKRWDDNTDLAYCNDTLYVSSGDTVWGYSNGVWSKQRQFDGKRIYCMSSFKNRLVVSFHDEFIFPGRIAPDRQLTG